MKRGAYRKGFTLIEVMISTVLISVVGISILQMHNHSAQMSHNMKTKFTDADWSLMPAFELVLEQTKKTTSFKEIMKPFNISDRNVRMGLEKKVSIDVDLLERIDASDILDELEEQDNEIIPVTKGLSLEVYTQAIEIEGHSSFVYRIIRQ